MDEYGPLTEQVEGLMRMALRLDEDRTRTVAVAWNDAGRPRPKGALVASRRAGREKETFEAGKAMASVVSIVGMAGEYDRDDVTRAATAARNAGIALATEDLIGMLGYTTREYAGLVEPWFSGFDDEPITGERKAA